MSTAIPLTPVVLQPHLALDLSQHFVAQIVASTGPDVPNFVSGVLNNNSVDEGKVYLFPFYMEDKPANCGVVRTRDKTSNGNNPQREAYVTVGFRLPDWKDPATGVTHSGQKRATQACETILAWIKPNGVTRTETDGTLPSGRLARLWKNPLIAPDGEDTSKRFMATITFELLYLDINVP